MDSVTLLGYLSATQTIELCIMAVLLGVILHLVDKKW